MHFKKTMQIFKIWFQILHCNYLFKELQLYEFGIESKNNIPYYLKKLLSLYFPTIDEDKIISCISRKTIH